ncbi:TIGR03032 family protein [Palleronia caenipelagi]|uniref:TIGR03032 family protein n=1 Tax=Palleronia caenipelagi TaxID=2489174 RepID=A0A547PN35_9RHOB|nr:TIGR03032 family protein [Palleronia caenipelagi]TRD15539.1 TIGR03032 family protein [Palleronia caenipelagi]
MTSAASPVKFARPALAIGGQDADFAFEASRMMPGWLETQDVSLAFSTYEIGKLFLVGLGADGRLAFSERSFPRAMGLGTHANGFWASSLYQIWRFDNYLAPDARYKTHDALYVPSMAYTTGDVDTHDIHTQDALPLFVATRFNCLAEPVPGKSFRAVWRPPFIDRFAAEDRCHLNGLAMQNGAPRYVTCVSQSNIAEGWREHRRDGGVVMDVASDAVLAGGLSMPHSPRLYGEDLWILQSGTGELGRIDLATGRFDPVCFLPGFARGFAIVGDWAVIGVSLPRDSNKMFSGLALTERLARERAQPRCMIAIVNLKTGDLEHWLRIGGLIAEIYDVVALPGIRHPHLVGLQKDDIRFIINPEQGPAFSTPRPPSETFKPKDP